MNQIEGDNQNTGIQWDKLRDKNLREGGGGILVSKTVAQQSVWWMAVTAQQKNYITSA